MTEFDAENFRMSDEGAGSQNFVTLKDKNSDIRTS